MCFPLLIILSIFTSHFSRKGKKKCSITGPMVGMSEELGPISLGNIFLWHPLYSQTGLKILARACGVPAVVVRA